MGSEYSEIWSQVCWKRGVLGGRIVCFVLVSETLRCIKLVFSACSLQM